MDNKIKEYLTSLNREIKRLEENLKILKKEHIKEMTDINFYTLENFGIAKDAEKITKVAGQLKILYNTRYDFMNIFEIKEVSSND